MSKTTKTVLLDLGDLGAEPGSERWCVAVREQARISLNSAKSTREHVHRWVKALQDKEGFRKLKDRSGRNFMSWDMFCQAPPPHGFGMTTDEVEALIASKPMAQQLAADPEEKPLNANGGDRKTVNGKSVLSDNTDSRGASAEYLVRRLKRDAPEIAQALGRGEYKSARAAGIAAGIVRVPTPCEICQREWKKMNASERKKFTDWIFSPETS